MQVRFVEPLQGAYEGMVGRLFRPFDLKKWFVVGFTCWLATFVEMHGGGGSTGYSGNWGQDAEGAMSAAESVAESAAESSASFWEVAGFGALGVAGCLFLACILLAFILVIVWLGSRGQFMFLDNVLHDRAQVKAPWARFKRLGNSLFLWNLAFAFLVIVVLGGVGLLAAVGMGLNSADSILAPDWSLIAACFAILLPLILVVLYIELFATHFVVPIMYSEDLTATAAWGRFLPVFRAHVGHFLVYGLFLFVLLIGVAIAVVITGCLTLCIGFLILIMPYIGTVALLPVHVTKRLFSLAFLHQVMPELGLFPVKSEVIPPLPV